MIDKTKTITVWERYNSKLKRWEHNHISDGYFVDEDKPIPKGCIQEKNWSNSKWRKFKAYLNKDASIIICNKEDNR